MFLNTVKRILTQHQLLGIFVLIHTLFAIFLGRMYALAPDEVGYLYTFNNVYALPINPWAQSGSGWITAPTVFLWVVYSPAKILNLLGIADFLSIRILSILFTSISLYLLLDILRKAHSLGRSPRRTIFLVFFIPSVFLWTSIGLRESFIIAEITLFLAGFNYLVQGMNRKGMLFLFLGSYGLVSTKNYLWACLMVALIMSAILFLARGIDWRQIIKLVIAGFLLPLAVYASTTSAYA